MSSLIFCPAHTKQPLDPVDFEERLPSKTAAWKRSACWAAHHSNWLSTRQALNALLEMFPQAIFPHRPPKFRKTIFDSFNNVAHPGRLASRRIISSWLTSPPGPVGVWPASEARFTATHA
jgi:hypothetical protein